LHRLVAQLGIIVERCTSWNKGFTLPRGRDDLDPQRVCSIRVKVKDAWLFEICDELCGLRGMQVLVNCGAGWLRTVGDRCLGALGEQLAFGVLIEMIEAEVVDDLVEDLFAVGGTQHGQTLDRRRFLEHGPCSRRSQVGQGATGNRQQGWPTSETQ
jgi:hypothetical protein